MPPAMALGPGAETRAPMAVAVIGGITVSTVMTLFVVPAFYGMVEDVKGVLKRAPAAAPAPKEVAGP